MSFSQDLRTFILADGTISGIVGQKVHALRFPPFPAYPAIIFGIITGTRSHHFQGADGLASPRIQFDCYAITYLGAELLAEALRSRMDGFKGVMGGSPGTVVHGIFFDSERDLYEDGADQGTGSGAGLYRRSVDYFVNYEEEAS